MSGNKTLSILEAYEFYSQNWESMPRDIIHLLEEEGEWRSHYDIVIFGIKDRKVELLIEKKFPEYKEITYRIHDYRNYLQNLSTKSLMSLRDSCYATNGWHRIFEYGGPEFSLEEVKEELAKREHLPNKEEGKKLRREASQGKRKNHKPF